MVVIWVVYCKYRTGPFAVCLHAVAKSLNAFLMYLLYCMIVPAVCGTFTQREQKALLTGRFRVWRAGLWALVMCDVVW